MKVIRFEPRNFRSFGTDQSLGLGAGLSVIIGPNGGGKTNLFDALAIFLRKFLIAKMTIGPRGVDIDGVPFRDATPNQELQQIRSEKHNRHPDEEQSFLIEVEVTSSDVDGIKSIIASYERMQDYTKIIRGFSYKFAMTWETHQIPTVGQRFVIEYSNGVIHTQPNPPANIYLDYLRNFENDALLRSELDESSIAFPIVYLPTSRAREGFAYTGQSGSQTLHELKRVTEAVHSRSPNLNYQYLAMQKLVKTFRNVVDCEGGSRERFEKLREVSGLRSGFSKLGYELDFEITNRDANQYSIILTKDGIPVRYDQLSSGEAAMLSFIMMIYGLGLKGSLILIDEPEMHLHPSWQEKMRDMFRDLSIETGNQIVIATHSASFISDRTIESVNRVFKVGAYSSIFPLNSVGLPDRGRLFRMVNLQNNAKMFFSDRILLVEGVSDELVMSELLKKLGVGSDTLEIISVGGKGNFHQYRNLLNAINLKSFIMADFDYLEQVGSEELKSKFAVEEGKIRAKVFGDAKSRDGKRLFEALERVASGDGDNHELMNLWDEIKAKRLALPDDQSDEISGLIDGDVARLSDDGTFVLRHGEIEDYLPTGIGKDVSRLVEALTDQRFFDLMPPERRTELEAIVTKALA